MVSNGGPTEDERIEKVRTLRESVPAGVDIDRLLAGSLAGPASLDRPRVPPWEYPEYAASHPGVALEELAHVRFPIRFEPGGAVSESSIHEFAKPGTTSKFFLMELLETVDLFLEMNAAGVWSWDPSERTVIHRGDAWLDPSALHDAWQARVAARLARDRGESGDGVA